MKYITPFSIITLLFLTSFLVACQSNTVETNQPTNQVIATPTTQVNTEPIKTDQITQDTQKPTKSINDWLKKESAIKCTFSGTMNNIQKSMSLYYAGKKWRMETQTIQNNQITNYYVMVNNNWIYTWNSANPTGSKMNTESVSDKTQSPMPSELKDYIEIDTGWNCKPWIEIPELFNQPTKQFIDLTAALS